MEKRRWKYLLKNNLLSLFLVVGLIVLVAVIAGDVVIKDGNVEVGDDLNVSNILFVNSSTKRVGIGTASPFYRLYITNITGDTYLGLRGGNPSVTAGESYLSLDSSRNNTGVGHVVRIKSESPSAGKADMVFYTQPSNGVYTERMRIDYKGNVGINTTAPDATLHVNNMFKLTPTDVPLACTTIGEGGIYFDDSLGEFCFCNGTTWNQFDSGGSC
ncbi:MAG: hypothetical protein RL557_380 [archaeon]|jgi:hypothetical protein